MSSGLCKEGSHRKDGQTCLLMPWDTVFSGEQQEQHRVGRSERKSEGVWWPHVAGAAQCLDIAVFRVKHRHIG